MIRTFIVSIFGIIAMFCIGFGANAPAHAQQISDARIKELALQAILENPEIIAQAIELLQERGRLSQIAQARNVRLELEADTNSPNLGNPDGDVTIVEFFDYNCGYCKRAMKALRATIADDPNLRVIMREWPILSEGSLEAARVALAAEAQNRYEEFHWAMMSFRGRANLASALKIARDLGLDMDKLQHDMETKEVADHIARNSALARSLGFSGTPAFIVGDQLAPGAVPPDELRNLITNARNDG